jgi:alginate O-acetyltransferase complex protein AlgI
MRLTPLTSPYSDSFDHSSAIKARMMTEEGTEWRPSAYHLPCTPMKPLDDRRCHHSDAQLSFAPGQHKHQGSACHSSLQFLASGHLFASGRNIVFSTDHCAKLDYLHRHGLMLFNSPQFIFAFLPIVLFTSFVLAWLREQMLLFMWLIGASLVFYAWDDPFRLLPLILSSIGFNFVVGRLLLVKQNSILLVFGVGGDLLVLGYFKYASFLVESFNWATGSSFPKPDVELPIGISFFTFTQIAFLVDAYRSDAREYEPARYALFVSFFPHLIAGPIYHHREIMPQFHPGSFRFNIVTFGFGLSWFALGLAKKVLLADFIAQYATPVFKAAAGGSSVGLVDAWFGACSFALQLYFDFSGYSDMAIGLAMMMGVRLPINFNSPYKADSLIEFWRRWHMTLSRFLRDYLYFPLGGNRKGPLLRYINLLITMLLGGLWHGAAWTFVIWGAIHGFGLMLNHAWNKLAAKSGVRLPTPLAWALTLIFVILAWVPFRAESISAALTIWKSMSGLNGLLGAETASTWQITMSAICICGLFLLTLFAPNTQQILSYPPIIIGGLRQEIRWSPSALGSIAIGALLGLTLAAILSQRPSEFLYFRF